MRGATIALMGSVRRAACAALLLTVTAGASAAATVPTAVQDAVHGRVAGWAAMPGGWAAVYLDRSGGGWCGLEGATWELAVVSAKTQRLASPVRIGRAMCGNSLVWVESGRFSDGKHPEVAFMLWTTPSIGATTYIYRVDGSRLVRLASFPGDAVRLGRGTVTARFENAGRSPSGKTREVYRFVGGRYRLTG
jgi:hypothetical protein